MGKQAFAAIVWIASLAIALFAGMQIGENQSSNERSDSSSRSEIGDGGQAAAAKASAGRTPHGADDSAEPRRGDGGRPRPSRSGIPAEEVKIELEGISTPQELSDLFMRYARQKLHQGPAGHKTLFRKIDELLKNRDLSRFMRDERALMPLLYPWVQFGFENQKQIVDMMETLYRTAAEEPQWFNGLDDDPFEMFTEGLAIMLPGMVDAERLAVFRGHAEAILRMEPDSLPDALKKNLRELRQNLEFWARPMSAEETLAQLQDPNVPDATKLQLLRRIPPDQLRGYDVAGLVARGLEKGDMSGLRVLRGLKLGGSDLVVLDRAYLAGSGGKENQWWLVRQYLQSTGRDTWPQMKPFFEDGLRRGGLTTRNFAQALTWMQDKPSAEYVQGVIESYDLPESIVAQLKSAYKLE